MMGLEDRVFQMTPSDPEFSGGDDKAGGDEKDDVDKGKNMNPEDDLASLGRDDHNPTRGADHMIHEETKT